jgi:hypothetical protein
MSYDPLPEPWPTAAPDTAITQRSPSAPPRANAASLALATLPGWFRSAVNLNPSKPWQFDCVGHDGCLFINTADRFQCIISANVESDSKRWIHLSVAMTRYNRTIRPDWDMLRRAKETFLGRDTYAISILPPTSTFVNLANVLHCFHCVDGHPLPEFSGFIAGIRSL